MENPLTYADLNSVNPSANHDDYRVESYTTTTTITLGSESEDLLSSPFVAHVSDSSNYENEENVSPSKQLAQRTSKSPIDREPVPPLKMLKSRASPMKAQSPQKNGEIMRSPRKLSSPEKRFPVRVPTPPKKQLVIVPKNLAIEDVLRDNEGLTKAIEILEDDDSELRYDEIRSNDALTSLPGDDVPNMDDTMISTFSAFSAGRSPWNRPCRPKLMSSSFSFW
jgi:hypothetical protein